jgi:hypothetical protein
MSLTNRSRRFEHFRDAANDGRGHTSRVFLQLSSASALSSRILLRTYFAMAIVMISRGSAKPLAMSFTET